MKVICTISGVEFRLADFSHGANTSTNGVHPIFNWETKQLLNQLPRWINGQLSPTERRLLFLALLNSTGLVDWKSPGNPDDALIQKSMEDVAKLATWVGANNEARIPLVQVTVKYPETHLMDNVKIWVEVWNKQRSDFHDKYKTVFREEKLSSQEQVLERLIKSTHKRTQDYAGQLAKWFMDSASVPTALQDYWTTLFKLKGYDVYNARRVDLEELVNHAQDHLGDYHGTIFGNRTLKHLRSLLVANIKGIGAELGDTIILEDDLPVVTDNMRRGALLAPDTKPHASEVGSKYPTKVDYLKALAYWNQGQTVAAEVMAREKADTLKRHQEDLDDHDAALEAEYSHQDDMIEIEAELPFINTSSLGSDL